MKLQYKITFKQDMKTIAEIVGLKNRIDASNLTVQEWWENVVGDVIKTEAFLEKLTGLEVRIEQVG